MKNRWFSLIALLAFVLAGCASSARAGGKEEDSVSSSQEVISNSSDNPLELGNTSEVTEMPSNPPLVEKFVDLSKKDLANQLQIDIEKIGLIKTKETLWPNAALGCPAPGKIYAQGKVPGFQIWLEAEGVQHVYHTDWIGQVVLCSIPSPEDDTQPPDITGPTPQIGVPID